MSNREEITKLVRGELTENEAENLMDKLESRNNEQIVNDLKNDIDFESLIQVQEVLENYLDVTEATEENKSSIEQTEKALENVCKAINIRTKELIAAEKKVKEILCN